MVAAVDLAPFRTGHAEAATRSSKPPASFAPPSAPIPAREPLVAVEATGTPDEPTVRAAQQEHHLRGRPGDGGSGQGGSVKNGWQSKLKYGGMQQERGPPQPFINEFRNRYLKGQNGSRNLAQKPQS